MRYTLSIQEAHYDALVEHLFPDRAKERAAYLLCSISSSDEEQRLLVQDLIRVEPDEIDDSSETHMSIRQMSFLRALKKANNRNQCFVFVHSHPSGFRNHSPQDDETELPLFRTAYVRIHRKDAIHGSLVLSDPDKPFGRVWLRDQSLHEIERIRVIGKRFTFHDSRKNSVDLKAFDRQIAAFGEPFQILLANLHVGVVGLGGTGSATCQQLIRLGVGRITACDGGRFEDTNINRVYGSRMVDNEKPKTTIVEREVEDIGLKTELETLYGTTLEEAVARKLRDCDVVFGCTDDEFGRAVLTKIAVYYLIPVFDMGVKIDSANGVIKSIQGRVTTLIPDSPCLFCRGTITGDVVYAEILAKTNPEEYKQRVKEGYAPELAGVAPAVIMFTSTVAASAVCEMFHRFTGYMGAERNSTELIHRFNDSKISVNSKKAISGCWCTDALNWGVGDTQPFLDMLWSDEK
jgi:molybdopterin/thiamine biosynthesis adenylyltransferase